MLLHEIQHLIQDYEGSANGTSSREAYEEFLANYERARADVKKEGLVKVSREKNILQSERIKKLTEQQQSVLIIIAHLNIYMTASMITLAIWLNS